MAEETINKFDLNTIINSIPEVILFTDHEGTLLSFNRKAKEDFFSNTNNTLEIGKSLFNYFEEPGKTALKNIWKSIENHEGIIQYEHEFKTRTGQIVFFKFSFTLNYSENHIANVCVTGRDVTKDRQAEEKLKKYENDSLQEKNTILETIGDGFFAVDDNWKVTYWNHQAEKSLGKLKKETIGQHLWELFPNSINTESYKKYHQAFETNRVVHFEDYYPPLKRWYDVSAYPSNNNLSVFFKDITHRKKIEQDIRESEEIRRLVIDSALDAIICIDMAGTITVWNPQAEKIFGWSKNEMIGKLLRETIIPPQHRDNHINGMKRYQHTGEGPILRSTIEITALDKEGREFPIELSITPIKQKNKEFFCAFIRDITERKSAENLLTEMNNSLQEQARGLEKSNEKYNLISKATHDMVWEWDLITGEVFRNTEGWKKIFRTDKKKIIGTREDWRAKTHPDDRERANKVFDDIINSNTKELFEMELRIVREDGNIGHIEDRGYVIRNDKGKAIRIIGATLDITERKLAEEKVLLRKQRYKSLVQNGKDLLAVVDAEGNYIYVSSSSKKILGIEPAMFIGKNAFSFIHEDDIHITKSGLAEVVKGNLVDIPLFRFKNAAGEWRWIESTITNLLNDPAVKGIVVNSRDVTDKKIADEKVQISEQRFKSLVQNATDLVAVINADGNFIYVSPSSKKIMGIEDSFFIGKNAFNFIHEDDLQIAFAALQEVLSGNFEEITQYRFKNGTGEWRWIESTGINLLHDPAVGGIVINARDVTERKLAEEQRKKSENRYRTFFEQNLFGFYRTTLQGKILECNDAFIKMLKYDSAEDLLGANAVDLYFSAEDRHQFINDLIKEKKKYDLEGVLKCKDKSWMYYIENVSLLEDEKTGESILEGIIINITERKLIELELAKSNERFISEKMIKQKEITDAVFTAQENERTHIGRELHDNVNQLLGATHLYIDMARKNEDARDSLLNSASSYTYNAIQEIRKLSKSLITPSIIDVGLIDSIKYVTEEIMLVHPIKIMFKARGFIEEGLTQKFKLNIFRIVQEQINNILKHAKAKNITITIEESVDRILFSIIDDGTGFNIAKTKPGIGITNIKSRCELYNCIMILSSALGKGTTLSITFNKIDSSNNNLIL